MSVMKRQNERVGSAEPQVSFEASEVAWIPVWIPSIHRPLSAEHVDPEHRRAKNEVPPKTTNVKISEL